MLKIHESEGVRTFRRDVRSIQLAHAIAAALAEHSRGLAYLSDIVKEVAQPYQATARAMPFEIGGLVYSVESDEPTRAYHKSRKVVCRPGRLEDYAPPRVRSTTIERKVREEVAKLEGWTNVFALREEARKYMDARLGAIEERIRVIENARAWEKSQ